MTGVAGLLALAGGATLIGGPWVALPDDEIRSALERRRSTVLAGAVSVAAAAGLLLWPVAAVAVAPADGAWQSLALFSVAAWAVGFGFLGVSALVVAAVAWRGPSALGPVATRALLDAAHLGIWSVSAPIGAVAVVATTAVAVQSDIAGPLLVAAAVAKVATAAVEVAGIGRRSGWNAGGWAAGSSGYATVAWFAVLLAALW